jgi:hypothetical protein
MNRSILIVICDFLLVSLLAFSTVDINKVADTKSQRGLNLQAVTNRTDSSSDLAAAMRVALEDVNKQREQLAGRLADISKQREQLMGRLNERERQAQDLQQQLLSRDQEAQRLHQTQAGLQQQYAAAQTNIQSLNQMLASSSTESVLSKEKLAAMEAEARKQAELAANLQQQLAELARSNQTAAAERQLLTSQLQVAEVEKRAAAEKVSLMEGVVKAEREEKARLAENVKALATHSSELAQEVRENRPLASNTIFNDFVTNRVQARFNAFRSTVLGIDSTRRRETQTILINTGTNIYALCHVQDTPLVFWNPGTEWESLTGTLSHNDRQLPIRSVSFALRDPRLVMLPLRESEARQLGCKVYRIASDAFKFEDAVLVGAREGYYGEARFQIDLSTPGYVKLDRNFIKGLFGKFNPSSGDLVFSRNGELLGVMANSSYCVMLDNFYSAASFEFGNDVRDQHTGATLAQLYVLVMEMPGRLQ